MGGTKIMVVQLREVIKSAIFAVIGLILIILLIYFFIPRENNNPAENGTSATLYKPGTYSAQIVLQNKPVDLSVTLSENRIEAIELEKLAESQVAFYPLFEPTLEEISQEILVYQTLEITPSTENTITRKILMDAIITAIAQAETE